MTGSGHLAVLITSGGGPRPEVNLKKQDEMPTSGIVPCAGFSFTALSNAVTLEPPATSEAEGKPEEFRSN
jgi:hypothetical protein